MKKLKAKSIIIIAFISAVLIIFSSLVISFFIKQNSVPTIEYPKDFLVITKDNSEEYEDYLHSLGYSIESFDKYLTDKGILSFSGNADNSIQFRLTENETDTSKEIVSFESKTEKEIEAIGKALFKDSYNGIIEKGENTFIEALTLNGKGNEKYCTLQYLTIKNGKIYSLNYYGSKTSVPKEEVAMVYETLESLEIPETGNVFANFSRGSGGRIGYIILIGIVIIFGLISIILISISLIRDLNIHLSNDNQENIKIKRRRKY